MNIYVIKISTRQVHRNHFAIHALSSHNAVITRCAVCKHHQHEEAVQMLLVDGEENAHSLWDGPMWCSPEVAGDQPLHCSSVTVEPRKAHGKVLALWPHKRWGNICQGLLCHIL